MPELRLQRCRDAYRPDSAPLKSIVQLTYPEWLREETRRQMADYISTQKTSKPTDDEPGYGHAV